MKCEDFQAQFADVLDSAPRTKAFDEHLAACSDCRNELAEMLECRRLVASLPEVESPSGLVSRIMAHVHESARGPSSWQRLFFPLRAKLPLHATAVMLIAITSVYLSQKQESPNAPLPIAAEPIAPPQSTPAEPSAATTPNEKSTDEKPMQKPRETRRAAPTTQRTEARAARTDIQPQPEPVKEARKSVRVPAQGVVAAMGPSGTAGFRDPGFRTFPGERELTHLGEPVPDYELFVRPRPNQGRGPDADAQSAGEDNAESSRTAEATTRSPAPSSAVVDVLWYTIPQDRYDQFKKELSAQASIETEKIVGAKDKQSSFRADGPFYVKVIVLAP